VITWWVVITPRFEYIGNKENGVDINSCIYILLLLIYEVFKITVSFSIAHFAAE
jgi:hypothetical protein